jgi:DHA1 family bicyclomycin/chloramphenicol resistance-like MFS transporter
VLANLALNLWVAPSLPWYVLPIPLYTLGMSLTMPSLTLLALEPFAEQRGLAASCQMFLQSMNNSVIAGFIAPMAWGSTLSLSLGMGGLMLTGAASSALYFRLMRREQN